MAVRAGAPLVYPHWYGLELQQCVLKEVARVEGSDPVC
jgi:hypothetical protein